MVKEMEAFYDLRSSHNVPKRYMHCQVTHLFCTTAACCASSCKSPVQGKA